MATWCFSSSPLHDLEKILTYQAAEASPSVSAELLDRIIEFIETITLHPKAFPSKADGTRMGVIPRLRHRVIYRHDVDDNLVEVLQIVHARKAWAFI